jgi:hypothetical protein
MAKPIDFKIAVTSRGRTEIALRIVPAFFDQIPDPASNQVSLVVASGDTEIGGIGTPMIVGKKKFHFSFCNPAGIGRMALLGRGFYKSKIPLKAIGVFPSWDRLVFAVHRDTGIHSIEEIKERKYPLIVSTRMLGKYRGTVQHTVLACPTLNSGEERFFESLIPVRRNARNILPKAMPMQSLTKE